MAIGDGWVPELRDQIPPYLAGGVAFSRVENWVMAELLTDDCLE